jgi:hypothetical protein
MTWRNVIFLPSGMGRTETSEMNMKIAVLFHAGGD